MDDNFGATSQWLERVFALHRNLMRKFANEEGLQLVHVEILQYLSVCNRYSDTTQAISEYLGQTKGSISQSLGNLEENGFIKKTQDKVDKRIFHLSLTTKGFSVAKRMSKIINLDGTNSNSIAPKLKLLLASIQKKHGFRGFGICKTCKFNENVGQNNFVCGLTKEKLSLQDIHKICKEHQEPEAS
ncbi:MAG: winged helix-turn-helix transcriptional regulator [Bdellovibrionaceae bacterium]|nr:winged helix-turn-helix transcriptional regulator [Pseudobdellovibrionaceae bacterium]